MTDQESKESILVQLENHRIALVVFIDDQSMRDRVDWLCDTVEALLPSQAALDAAERKGCVDVMNRVIDSLKGYPHVGMDIDIGTEVDRLCMAARAAERERCVKALKQFIHDAEGDPFTCSVIAAAIRRLSEGEQEGC